MDSRQQYVYETLSKPNSIRLILIEPGAYGAPIALTVFESLLTKPADGAIGTGSHDWPIYNEYYPLSYVWGDATHKVSVTVDGCHFEVTCNLHAFLREARIVDGVAGPFWVDAICINQNDLVEKGVQVEMMGDVYRDCAACMVWLGAEDEDDTAGKAFKLMRLVERWACHLYALLDGRMDLEPWQEREEDYLNLRNGVFQMINSGGELADRLMDNMALFLSGKMQHTDILRMKQLLIPTPEMWIAFFKLCGAPYFERVWTIQEFALPKSLTIQCGSESCDVRTLQMMHFVVDLNIKNIRVSPFPTPGFGEWGSTDDYWMFCGQRDLQQVAAKESRQVGTLLETVIMHKHQEATNARDKVYGLFGCAIPDPHFKADYAKSVDEVYRMFAIRQIELGYLHVLLPFVDMPGRLAELPSWVPDWSPTDDVKAAFDGRYYKGAGPGERGRLSGRLSEDGRGLFLNGCLVDVVMIATKSSAPPPNLQLKPFHQDEEEILLRTSCLDTIKINRQRQRADPTQPFYEQGASTGTFPNIDKAGRLFIFTSSGYVGLAPPNTRPGDFVCIFQGYDMPIVLHGMNQQFEKIRCRLDALPAQAREAEMARMMVGEGSFKMIGQAYVHGIMDGELMPELESRERVMQEFEIR